MTNNNSNKISIRSTFNNNFNVVFANTEYLLNIAHRIRYEVFSVELAYFDKNKFGDCYETDKNDSVSQQCLVKVKSDDIYAGCVRLVAGIKNGQRNQLPFERYYGDGFFKSDAIDITTLDPSSYGELSRAAIITQYRRDKQSHFSDTAVTERIATSSREERRNYPLISLGLYLASAVMGLNSGYERVFAMMEPRLARQLRMYGIHFDQLAPVVMDKNIPAAYKRAAFQITKQALLEGINPDIGSLISDISADLAYQGYAHE